MSEGCSYLSDHVKLRRAMSLLDRLGTQHYWTSEVFCCRKTDHVSSRAPVNGDAENTVALKNIHVRKLTGLNTVGHNIRSRHSGVGGWSIRIEITVGVLFVVQDTDDLFGFYHEAPVIVREEGTLAEEVVCVRVFF